MDEPLAETFKRHWPEYLMEAWGLGTFMISACFFTALLEHPGSTVRHWIPDQFIRRVLTGIAMGLTAIFIISSPWGKRSGGHLNPALTWTFFRLKKISFGDAFFYSAAQFLGGVLGVLLCALFIRAYLEHPAVHYAVTVPGPAGVAIAFLAEAAISFVLMFTVLIVSNHSKLSRYTVFFAGALIALYITFEAPFSGMSMNPARSVGSAFFANDWRSIWIYFAGPLLGMLLAAETYVRTKGLHQVFCAKLHHHNGQRCIFHCNFGMLIKQSN
ncbi:aquaporin [bacterium]|nr:aquaporin [bacterium]